jgi:hypothetical protein
MFCRPNLTDAANLPQTEVASETYRNVYVYTRRRLCTAYGTAILVATVAILLGLHTVFTVGASYSNEFSTILRVSRHAHLSREVTYEDATGQDPLPKYLAKTTLTITKSDDEDEGVPMTGEQDTGCSN